MKPSFDPGGFLVLFEQSGELKVEPLEQVLPLSIRPLRIAQSKSALKRWRRSFEFHQSNAVHGRKEVPSGNCNS